MKTNVIHKTNHFWKRAWERGYNQSEIDCLLKDVKKIKTKTLLIFGKEKLKNAGHKTTGNIHLVIVAKKNTLITLFEVPDLFGFLKSNVKKNLSIIF
jgi:hypothetical protein